MPPADGAGRQLSRVAHRLQAAAGELEYVLGLYPQLTGPQTARVQALRTALQAGAAELAALAAEPYAGG